MYIYYVIYHLLIRNMFAHDYSRISWWAQPQKEAYEARALPAPEPLFGSDGLCIVLRCTVMTAAKWVCGKNK
jgi:hypothetical protein